MLDIYMYDFVANSVMGVGLPSEYWLREWIEKVKYTQNPEKDGK